jgi:3-deoxy-D-manno-octulosonate 8-phosphate phosphatase (KDO 8-P phosphatase)
MRYRRSPEEITERAARIRILLLDVDGVLTDGGILLHPDGGESKVFNVRDGLGIRLLQRAGIEVGFISGRNSRVVARRAEDLGIGLVVQGTLYKLPAYEEIMTERGLSDRDVAYVGDDIVDIPILRRVGLAVATAGAIPTVGSYCHVITDRDGGRGAVREVCELILQAQGRWEEMAGPFLGSG